jgi:hypothetical protein
MYESSFVRERREYVCTFFFIYLICDDSARFRFHRLDVGSSAYVSEVRIVSSFRVDLTLLLP